MQPVETSWNPGNLEWLNSLTSVYPTVESSRYTDTQLNLAVDKDHMIDRRDQREGKTITELFWNKTCLEVVENVRRRRMIPGVGPRGQRRRRVEVEPAELQIREWSCLADMPARLLCIVR